MINLRWKRLFQPHIWQRGEEYYHLGYVAKIEKMDRQVLAQVEGSEMYSVSITFDEEQSEIERYSCSCPYGADGTPCKHLAAVLCALKSDEIKNEDFLGILDEESEEAEYTVEELVSKLTEKKVRELLIQFVKEKYSLREKLRLIALGSVSKATKRKWIADLNRLTAEAGDRHGFIDYDQAYDYCWKLEQYVNDRVPNLMNHHLIMDAFGLSWQVFILAMEQEMDDSDGGLSSVADCCSQVWSELIPEANPQEQLRMFRCFAAHFSDNEIIEYFLNEWIYDAPWGLEVSQEMLSFIDQQILMASKKPEERYRLKTLIPKRFQYMERTGADEEEKANYLKQYHHLSSIREIEIAQMMEKKDWEKALELLEESKELDQKDAKKVENYYRKKIEIYEITGNQDLLKAELMDYVHHCRQQNMDYVRKLKGLMTSEEWDKERTKLLESPSMYGLKFSFLAEEQMIEELMQGIEKHCDLFALEEYRDLLIEKYAPRCRRVYISYLEKAMEEASNRNSYRDVIQVLQEFREFPGGKDFSQLLANVWKVQYPRRTSMIDELKKAGF